MSPLAESRSGFHCILTPTLEQFAEAAEICYTRWPYMRELDSPARFRAFQELKVELCALIDARGSMQCVGYMAPGEIEVNGENLTWHYLFQVASRPEVAGAGFMLFRQLMKWYPAIFSMGITPDAERLYKALRWQPLPGFWRGVHPLNLPRLLNDFGGRIENLRLRQLLLASAGLGNLVGTMADAVCSLGARCVPWQPSEGKGAAVGTYLSMFSCAEVRAADVGGNGRLLSLSRVGSLRQHAAIWRALRQRHARLCEVLLSSEAERNHAMRMGYIPLPLQAWCWDPQGIVSRAVPALRERGMSFFDTDKVI